MTGGAAESFSTIVDFSTTLVTATNRILCAICIASFAICGMWVERSWQICTFLESKPLRGLLAKSPADYFAVWKGQSVSGMTHVFGTFLLT
jgi:hypothetical protein